MLQELDDYDWEEAFMYANEPEAVPPGADIGADGFGREDVIRVIALAEGENDGADWVGVFELRDGRFAALRAGCDYTGWDCQAGGDSNVATTEADIIRFGLSQEERKRLDLRIDGE